MRIVRIALAGLMLADMQAVTPPASAHGFGGVNNVAKTEIDSPWANETKAA